MVQTLEKRMAAVTGLDLRPPYAEYLQVVNYGLGGHYEPHFDHATVRELLGWLWGGGQGGSSSAFGMVLGVIMGWFLGWSWCDPGVVFEMATRVVCGVDTGMFLEMVPGVVFGVISGMVPQTFLKMDPGVVPGMADWGKVPDDPWGGTHGDPRDVAQGESLECSLGWYPSDVPGDGP